MYGKFWAQQREPEQPWQNCPALGSRGRKGPVPAPFLPLLFLLRKLIHKLERFRIKGKNLKSNDKVTVKGKANVQSFLPHLKMALGTWVGALLDL